VGRPENVLQAAKQPVPGLRELDQVALARRPDVLSKRYAAEAAHDFADEPLLRLVPTVSVNGQAQALTNPPATGRWIDETIGATATWTIYDAGSRYADKHLRDANASIADLNTRTLVRSVASQVESAVVALKAQQAAFQQAELSAQAARKSADETSVLYRQGLAKAIELVDANDSRFLAEVNDASAEYSMAEAYLNLRQALGLDPIGTEYR
jgi:outer membrane protein TolC